MCSAADDPTQHDYIAHPYFCPVCDHSWGAHADRGAVVVLLDKTTPMLPVGCVAAPRGASASFVICGCRRIAPAPHRIRPEVPRP